MHEYWARKYSVVLPDSSGRNLIEFVFTFGFGGSFDEYCRHARLMDGLVTTLEWVGGKAVKVEFLAEQAGDFFDRGRECYRRRDLGGAVREFTRAIELRPDVPAAYQERGLAYARMGQLEEAIADFQQAIGRSTSTELVVSAHYNSALAFEKLHRYPEALLHYLLVIKLQPGHGPAWCNRGSVLLRQGEFEQAVKSYSNAIEADPDDCRAYWGRAMANLELSRSDRAGLTLVPSRPPGAACSRRSRHGVDVVR